MSLRLKVGPRPESHGYAPGDLAGLLTVVGPTARRDRHGGVVYRVTYPCCGRAGHLSAESVGRWRDGVVVVCFSCVDRDTSPDTAARDADIVARRAAGESAYDLGRVYGITATRVNQIFKKGK